MRTVKRRTRRTNSSDDERAHAEGGDYGRRRSGWDKARFHRRDECGPSCCSGASGSRKNPRADRERLAGYRAAAFLRQACNAAFLGGSNAANSDGAPHVLLLKHALCNKHASFYGTLTFFARLKPARSLWLKLEPLMRELP